jgi:hypothetical protein
MLSPEYKPTLWPSTIKYEYVDSVKLREIGDYDPLLDELKKLASYKDYILVSNYAENEIKPVSDIIMKQSIEESHTKPVEVKKDNEEKDNKEKENKENKEPTINYLWFIIPLGVLLAALILAVLKLIRYRNKKNFW